MFPETTLIPREQILVLVDKSKTDKNVITGINSRCWCISSISTCHLIILLPEGDSEINLKTGCQTIGDKKLLYVYLRCGSNECLKRIMSRIIRTYQNLLKKHPIGTQAFQAGILMGIGDQIAQNFVEKREIKNLNFFRTAQFVGIGFCIAGPATRTWYGILDKHFGSKGTSVVLKKVACDQLLFAPLFIVVLISSIGLMQGNNIKNVRAKLEDEYVDILKNNYKLWPMVQLINFYLVPLHYQVLVVQSVAVLWNTYVSYRTNKVVDKTIQ